MRWLFTSKTGSLGHLLPLVPLALAAVEAGDEVAVASGADRQQDVEARGLRFFRAGLALEEIPARMRAVVRDLTALGGSIPARWGYDFDHTMAEVFTTVHAPPMVSDLERVVGAFEPEVVVCDVSEYGAPVAAALADLTCVSHGLGLPVPARVTREAARWAAAMWAQRGLTPPQDAGMYRTLHVSICPPCLDPGDGWPDAPVQHIGPGLAPPAPLDWLASLPDRPTVYVTLGTARGREASLIADVVNALATIEANIVVTVGPDNDPHSVAALAANVTARRFIPQHDLLPSCSAVVCHGGSGTMLGALAHGVPVVVLPHMADHHYNAKAVQRVRCGVALDEDHRSAHDIRTAVRTVLDDGSIHRAVAHVQTDIANMPAPDAVVRRIQHLATHASNDSATQAPTPRT